MLKISATKKEFMSSSQYLAKPVLNTS